MRGDRLACSLAILAALSGFAVASPPIPEVAQGGRIALHSCRAGGLAARCGTYEVFENRATRAGRRLALRVVVLPARTPRPRPDAIFYLAGGPGVGATSEASLFAESWAALLAERDVVLVDQRGTGGSNPLDCDLGVGMLTHPVAASAVAACRAKLETRADLRLHSTALAMDDLDGVRAALGYRSIDLLAYSYGTLAAQVYLRRHGERVRAAVLLGVVPPDPRAYLSYAEDAEHALTAVLAACAAQPTCHAAFPRPREELAEVLRRLAERPVEVPVETGNSQPRATVELTRDLFASTLRVRLYSAKAAARIPRAIHRAYRGDYADMAHAAWVIGHSAGEGLSEGLMLSVDCTESLGALTTAEIVRRSAGTFLGPEPLLRRLAACGSWPHGEPQSESARPVAASVPTLLLSGAWDPVTPPSGAERVRQGLPDSLHMVVREAGHALEDPCTTGIAAAFLAAGSVRGLDASCLERRPPVVFATEP